jgi:hypothetical protein
MKEQQPSKTHRMLEIYFVTKMYAYQLCLYNLTSICEDYNPCRRILHLTVQLTYITHNKNACIIFKEDYK